MRKRTQLELDGIENGSIRLRTKPTARLSYAFVPQAGGNEGRRPDRLIIFLGGLDNPINIWQGTLSRLAELSVANGFGLPPILAYDRFGIGQSDPDPSDVGKPLEEYHDGMDAVRDLRQLLIQIAEQKLGREESELDELRIVFCAYSFGVCVARLYAQTFPGSLEALLMIDSAIANQLAETFTPNPDIPEVWERARHSLPPGTTPQMCRHINQKIMSSPYSGYALTSRERMRWTNMPDLLPFNDRPRLQGPDQGLPLVTVLCSDPQVLIPMTAKMFNVSAEMIRATYSPIWAAFMDGLPFIQGRGIGRGPIFATGCSHDVPRQGPEYVARELLELLVASSKPTKSRI